MAKSTPEAGHELLNIKQAAAFLNVSEVSLRRWTDSGRLSCLRVGGRRERRFWRHDLLACTEQQAVARHGTRSATVELEGISIDYSTHLCALYETDMGRTKMAVPFLASGLRQGDSCYLIAEPAVQDQLLGHLREQRCGLDRALRSGQFHVRDGFDSIDDTLNYLETAFIEGTRQGAGGIRLVGNMSWFLARGMRFDDLMRFEMSYNHAMAHRYPVVSLCLYDVREFSGQDVLSVLKSHEDTFEYPLAHFLGP